MSSTFYFTGGETASSIEEFKQKITIISDDAFNSHLNSEKNDFYNWILNGLGRKDIAKEIRRVKTRSGIVKKLKKFV